MNHSLNQQEKCAHGKNLAEPCSQCNKAWNDITSPHQEGWAERFDETDFGFVMNAKPKQKLKSFIRKELTSLRKADCERFRGMLVQDNGVEETWQEFRETVLTALSKMEEETV